MSSKRGEIVTNVMGFLFYRGGLNQQPKHPAGYQRNADEHTEQHEPTRGASDDEFID
jgi:hypothetical protein